MWPVPKIFEMSVHDFFHFSLRLLRTFFSSGPQLFASARILFFWWSSLITCKYSSDLLVRILKTDFRCACERWFLLEREMRWWPDRIFIFPNNKGFIVLFISGFFNWIIQFHLTDCIDILWSHFFNELSVRSEFSGKNQFSMLLQPLPIFAQRKLFGLFAGQIKHAIHCTRSPFRVSSQHHQTIHFKVK